MGFEIDSLVQSASKILDWQSYLWDVLDTWGHYDSFIVILYLMGKLIYVLVSIVVTHKKGTLWVTAKRLNRSLLAEFRNNLIRTLNEPERRNDMVSSTGIELEEFN